MPTHLPPLILDLALILGMAGITTLVFKRLKQPLVLGYIIAGVIVGPNISFLPTIAEKESISIWAEIGVIFLLFSLGLEFSFKKLLKVGGVAGITALLEVGATMLCGYLLGVFLGWSSMDSLFMGGILAIASTTIIMRAFDEKGVKSQKFAGIVVGILVVEDLVAVVLMVILSTLGISNRFEGTEMLASIVKLIFFLILWFLAGIFFLPTFLKRARRLMNDETMLIVSIALCFLMVVLATQAGFSPALGAFIMGSILAETTHAEKIEHLIKPVKDLFGAIFFISVGLLIDPKMIQLHYVPVILATLILLIGKPLFVATGALITGQPLKTAVQSGMSLSQIGEFSFIIAALGKDLRITSEFLYPVAVAVSVVTAFTTPYMIQLSEPAYRLIDSVLPPKWKHKLHSYSTGTQTIAKTSDFRKIVNSYLINILVNSVIIITLILIAIKYLHPMFQGADGGALITTTISLSLLAPFLWALSFRRTERNAYAVLWTQRTHRGPLIGMQIFRLLLAIFYVGFLLDRLFSPLWAFVVGALIVIVLVIFSRRIQAFYGRIESRFFNNLNEREEKPEALAPWDTHLTWFELSPESPGLGETLVDLKFRERFGVNIAMIERGNKLITAPQRTERLFPHDRISVIGTDEQLRNFRNYLEPQEEAVDFSPHKQEVILQQITLRKNSSLVNKSIRESAIRERTQGLIVGVERGDERILNPDSSLVFKEKDVIWIVGNPKRIKVILKENTMMEQT